MVVMQEGKIEEMGDADQIYNNPNTDYTKKLIDAIPEGKLEDIKSHLESKGLKYKNICLQLIIWPTIRVFKTAFQESFPS